MALLMGVDSDPIFGISPFHCLLLFNSDLQGPLGFTNVGVVAILTWELIHHAPLPFIWSAGLGLHQGLPKGPQWLECNLNTKRGADPF